MIKPETFVTEFGQALAEFHNEKEPMQVVSEKPYDEIDSLRAWKEIITNTPDFLSAVDRYALSECIKPFVQCWKDHVKDLQAENNRLKNFNDDSRSFNLGYQAAIEGKPFEYGYDNYHDGYDYEIWEMGWLWQKGKDILKANADLLDVKKQYMELITEIEAVSCGEKEVATDDSDGMGWIYKHIQQFKESGK